MTEWVDKMQKLIEQLDDYEALVEWHDGPDPETCLCCRFGRAMNELHDITAELRELEAVEG